MGAQFFDKMKEPALVIIFTAWGLHLRPSKLVSGVEAAFFSISSSLGDSNMQTVLKPLL